MAKQLKPPLPDSQYLDDLIHRLEENKGNLFKLPDGTSQEGYLLEHNQFEQVLFILMRLRDYVDKKPPGPKGYETFWEAYCAEPDFREYLWAEENYVSVHGKE